MPVPSTTEEHTLQEGIAPEGNIVKVYKTKVLAPPSAHTVVTCPDGCMQNDFYKSGNASLDNGDKGTTTEPGNTEASLKDKCDCVFDIWDYDETAHDISSQQKILTGASNNSSMILKEAVLTPQDVLSAMTETAKVKPLPQYEGRATRSRVLKYTAQKTTDHTTATRQRHVKLVKTEKAAHRFLEREQRGIPAPA